MAESKGWWGLTKQTVNEFSSDRCGVFAAALAYYAVFSMPPLLILIIWIAGFVWEPSAVSGQLERQMTELMGQTGAEQVKQLIDQNGVSGGSLPTKIAGIAVLIFGATGVFVQLQQALNVTWEVQPDPEQGGWKNFLFKRLLSLGMILTIAFLLLISLVLSSVLMALTETIGQALPVPGGAAAVVNFIVSVAVITLLFAAIFKFLPDVVISWKDVWFGAGVTAFFFVVGKFLLGLYLANKDLGSTYGAAGSLVFILVWIYYSSMILLFGAETTQVWARRYGDRIQPKEGAVRIVERQQRVEAG